MYVAAQMLGGILGAAALFAIASGKAGFSMTDGFGANGYAAHSPGGHSLMSCLMGEILLSFLFVFVFAGATAPSPTPPAAIAGGDSGGLPRGSPGAANDFSGP